MGLGILLVSMGSAAAMSLLLWSVSAPVWIVVIAYPVTGTVMLVALMLLSSFTNPAEPDAIKANSARSDQWPVQRRTTPTVANISLISAASDNVPSYSASNSARCANVELLRSDTCHGPVNPGRSAK